MKFFILLFLFSAKSFALPLYEFGVAGGAGYLPDYPAANEGRVRQLVVPNFRYRGKIFRADESSGVRARLLNLGRFDLDLSFGAAFPVNSGSNSARKGMDTLNWLVEIGPRLFTTLWFEQEVGRLRFAAPLRGVYSTDGTSATYQGLVTVPGFILEKYHWPCESCRVITALGSTFASEGVGDYFYQVDRKDVRPFREEFNGKAGYVGSDLTAGLAWYYKQLEVFVGGRASTYAGSANQGSPLFKSKENIAGFLAIGWLFYKSEEEAKL